MDQFDKQRIANAIWTLQQYEIEILKIATLKEIICSDREVEQMFNALEDINAYLKQI